MSRKDTLTRISLILFLLNVMFFYLVNPHTFEKHFVNLLLRHTSDPLTVTFVVYFSLCLIISCPRLFRARLLSLALRRQRHLEINNSSIARFFLSSSLSLALARPDLMDLLCAVPDCCSGLSHLENSRGGGVLSFSF